MMKELLGAVSALALFASAAAAQDAPATTTTPPGATPAPQALPPAGAGGAAGGTAEIQPPPPATSTDPATAPAGMTPTEQAASPQPPAGATVTGPAAPAAQAGAATPPAMPPADQPAAVGANVEGPASPAAQAGAADTAAADAGKPVSTDDMMGRQVEGSDGQPLGRVSDVIVDPATGQVQRLVIASGGFLGLGAKNVAVDFAEVEVRPEGGIVAKGLTQASVEGMPEFDVTAETAPLDPRPELPATTGAAGGIATPGMGAGAGADTAGGATAPPPAPAAQ